MELSDKQEFKITKTQKQTLRLLRSKYKINTSQFIRDAINEKLERDKNDMFKNYKEVQSYLKQINNCPF